MYAYFILVVFCVILLSVLYIFIVGNLSCIVLPIRVNNKASAYTANDSSKRAVETGTFLPRLTRWLSYYGLQDWRELQSSHKSRMVAWVPIMFIQIKAMQRWGWRFNLVEKSRLLSYNESPSMIWREAWVVGNRYKMHRKYIPLIPSDIGHLLSIHLTSFYLKNQ